MVFGTAVGSGIIVGVRVGIGKVGVGTDVAVAVAVSGTPRLLVSRTIMVGGMAVGTGVGISLQLLMIKAANMRIIESRVIMRIMESFEILLS
jgi:hypothetical protein